MNDSIAAQPDHYVVFLVISILVLLVVTVLYCLTLYRFLQRIPKEKHKFPSWFVWLFLIPWVGFVFQWIMLPFGIPSAIKKQFSNDQDAIAKADTLFKLGLAQVALTTIGIFVHRSPVNEIAGVIGIVLWIMYWVKIVKFKKQYLT